MSVSKEQREREKHLAGIAHADGVLTHLHVWGDQCPQGTPQGELMWIENYRQAVIDAEHEGFVFDDFRLDRWDPVSTSEQQHIEEVIDFYEDDIERQAKSSD